MTHNIGIDEKIQATITKIEGLASPILWRASRNECLCRQHQNAERRDDCLDLLSEAVRPVIADLYRQQEQLLNALVEALWPPMLRRYGNHRSHEGSTYALCEKYLKEQQQQQRGV